MCTAITYKTAGFYIGRNMDYEFSYGDEVVFTPRRFPFSFLHAGELPQHYAMLGMAHVADGRPLYYDAVNEAGLGVVGLSFKGSAVYHEARADCLNLALFEFIPWLLGAHASVKEARAALSRVNLIPTPFSPQLPSSPLHFLLADKEDCLVLEPMADGLRIHENPVGVLTNNPPFEMQMYGLSRYMGLSARQPENRFAPKLPLHTFSRGMGALGLPGDLSSPSRFVRAVFTKMNSVSGDGEEESVNQFFHILGAAEQQRGCCEVENGKYEITLYSSCMSAGRGVYYYRTYGNHQITAVDMRREDPDGSELIRWPLVEGERILYQN